MKILFFDTETTGLDFEKSALKVNGTSRKELESTDTACEFESDDNGETVEENEVTAAYYECDDCGARWEA